MKYLLACLFLACLFSACKQQSKTENDKITIGTIESINSTVLKEQRKVWVYVPDSYKNNLKSARRYPVVYLLDGDAHFFSVVGMIHQLSSINGNTICPEMIVVGIPNTDRTRDLTPTHVVVDPPYMDSSSSKTSGGGEKFMDFIEKELMPYIDSSYRTNPYKVLIGHSFGGLTVINTLMHRPKLFNAYVAIDPSMWWDGQKLLMEAQKNLPTTDFSHTGLFLGIANTMDAGMDTVKVQLDTAPFTKHIRSILKLGHYLTAAKKQNGMRFDYKYYNSDNHGSVPLITEYDALHFLFSYYKLNLTNSDFANITKQLIAKVEAHYDTVSAEMGFKVPPDESIINQLAYQPSSAKHNDEAEYLATLNTTNYPQSSNAFDTLGDIYSAENKKAQAAENYKKSLAIEERPETRKKLDKLEGK